MTERKTKPKVATRSIARKTAKPASPKRSAPASSKSPARSATKHDRIIAMLRTSAGATIASLVTATEWQQHSVRGFLAGVVRKRLGLNLVSEQTDKGRVYRCQSAFKFDPGSASNFDPFERRVLTVALASSELAGVAETWRARVA